MLARVSWIIWSNVLKSKRLNNKMKSNIRQKIEIERELFIKKWCADRGLEHRLVDNYNKAAAQWAFANCFN